MKQTICIPTLFKYKFVRYISYIYFLGVLVSNSNATDGYENNFTANVQGIVNEVNSSNNHYTGQLSVNLPIYTLRQGKIAVPITLNYNGTDLKLNEHPGWVGHSWHLNAGGTITRVKTPGADDKDIFYFNFCGYTGKFYGGNQDWTVISDSHIEVDAVAENREAAAKLLIHQSNRPPQKISMGDFVRCECSNPYDNPLRAGPDFNFPSFKLTTGDGLIYEFGSVFNDPSLNPIVDKSEDMFPGTCYYTYYNTWHLVKISAPGTDDFIEFNYTRDDGEAICNVQRAITYNSEYGGYGYDMWGSISTSLISYFTTTNHKDKNGNDLNPTVHIIDQYRSPQTGIEPTRNTDYYGYTGSIIYPYYLSSISTRNTTIEFESLSTDLKELRYKFTEFQQFFELSRYGIQEQIKLGRLPGQVAYLYFHDKIPKWPIFKWRQLDNIRIKDKNDNTIKMLHFIYSNNDDERLRLLKVNKYEGAEYTNLYSFQYKGINEGGNYNDNLPGYFSGHENYKGHNLGSKHFPWLQCNNSTEFYQLGWSSSNRAITTLGPNNVNGFFHNIPHEDFLNKKTVPDGLLSKITLGDIGGYYEYEYENNKSVTFVKRDFTDASYSVHSLSATETTQPGHRLKKIKKFDGTNITEINYKYELGIRGEVPTLAYQQRNVVCSDPFADEHCILSIWADADGVKGGDEGHYVTWDPVNGEFVVKMDVPEDRNTNVFDKFSTTPGNFISENSSSYVTYSKVTEEIEGKGKTVYYYSNFMDSPELYTPTQLTNNEHMHLDESLWEEEKVVSWNLNNIPFTSRSQERGKLIAKYVYKESDDVNPVFKERYFYDYYNDIQVENMFTQSYSRNSWYRAADHCDRTTHTERLLPGRCDYDYDIELSTYALQGIENMELNEETGGYLSKKTNYVRDDITGRIIQEKIYQNNILYRDIRYKYEDFACGPPLEVRTYNSTDDLLSGEYRVYDAHRYNLKEKYLLKTGMGYQISPSSSFWYKLNYDGESYSSLGLYLSESYEYDNYGNLTEATRANDNTKSVIWGYNNTYPIAEVLNANSDQIIYESYEDVSSWSGSNITITNEKSVTGTKSLKLDKTTTTVQGNAISKSLPFEYSSPQKFMVEGYMYTTSPNIYLTLGFLSADGYQRSKVSSPAPRNKWVWISKEFEIPESYNGSDITSIYACFYTQSVGTTYFDEIRVYPVDAQMKSYTYKPVIGITSETDEKGDTKFYEYQNNKLSHILDKDQNVLKRYDYHYRTKSTPTKLENLSYSFSEDKRQMTVSLTTSSDRTYLNYYIEFGSQSYDMNPLVEAGVNTQEHSFNLTGFAPGTVVDIEVTGDFNRTSSVTIPEKYTCSGLTLSSLSTSGNVSYSYQVDNHLSTYNKTLRHDIVRDRYSTEQCTTLSLVNGVNTVSGTFTGLDVASASTFYFRVPQCSFSEPIVPLYAIFDSEGRHINGILADVETYISESIHNDEIYFSIDPADQFSNIELIDHNNTSYWYTKEEQEDRTINNEYHVDSSGWFEIQVGGSDLVISINDTGDNTDDYQTQPVTLVFYFDDGLGGARIQKRILVTRKE